jgi:hypothetical protein
MEPERIGLEPRGKESSKLTSSTSTESGERYEANDASCDREGDMEISYEEPMTDPGLEKRELKDQSACKRCGEEE